MKNVELQHNIEELEKKYIKAKYIFTALKGQFAELDIIMDQTDEAFRALRKAEIVQTLIVTEDDNKPFKFYWSIILPIILSFIGLFVGLWFGLYVLK